MLVHTAELKLLFIFDIIVLLVFLVDMISKENDDTVNKEIFDFVSMLSTNENVVKRGDVSEGKWKEVFHEENVYKMIYALEVIESIVENVSYSEKEDDAEWVKDFVNKKGYKYLIDLFIGKLSDVDSDKEKSRTSRTDRRIPILDL